MWFTDVMATRIAGTPARRKSAAVNWSKYADGATWLLERGEDFPQTASRAAATFRMWCVNNGFHARTEVVSVDQLKVQAIRKAAS